LACATSKQFKKNKNGLKLEDSGWRKKKYGLSKLISPAAR
jgi:hypothetical protein